MWLTGLWPSPPILGWPPESCMGASPTTPDTFSSSRRFKHAALGLRLRSKKRKGHLSTKVKTIHLMLFQPWMCCWESHLWLVVLNWGWHWRLGAEWRVWSEVCRGWGAAGTSFQAPWMPRWCPVPWDARGHCWPLAAPSRAPSSPQGEGPRHLPMD